MTFTKVTWPSLMILIIYTQNVKMMDQKIPITCPDVPKLHVIPGFGWDALRNKDSKQVLQFTFNQCRITPDGKFMIPDDSTVIYIKEDVVSGNIIENWMNYTAPDARGFQVGNDIWPREYLSLYFSYSDEYQEIKKLQLKHQAFTMRTQLRQPYYRLTVARDVVIVDDVRNQFLEAMKEIAKGRVYEATYILQVIIRDYGTHYSKSIDVGTVFIRDDFVPNIFLTDRQKYKIIAAAQISFLDFIGLPIQSKDKVDASLLNAYNNAKVETRVREIGGPNWQNHIHNEDLVAIERSGDLFTGLITKENFPSASSDILIKCQELMGKAIEDYYKNNIHEGCTDQKAENFDYLSNIEDGSCRGQLFDYIFGGVYTTHDQSSPMNEFDISYSLFTKSNPLTGNASCPLGFTSTLLYSHFIPYKSRCDRYNTQCCTTYRPVLTYSCMASSDMRNFSILIFGGLYSKQVNNIITKKATCPQHFTALLLFNNNLTLCISTNKELINHQSLRFGGLTTARMGLRCPVGYEGHLAVTFEGNEIHYCLQATKSINYGEVLLLVSPPFLNASSQVFAEKTFENIGKDRVLKVELREKESTKSNAKNVGSVIAICLVMGFLLFFGCGYWHKDKIRSHFHKKWNDQSVASMMDEDKV